MALDLGGQTPIEALAANILPFPNEMTNIVGTTATNLVKPSGKKYITLMAVKGDWSVGFGDKSSSGMPTAFIAASAGTAGSAAFPVHEKEKITIQAPESLTVKAYAATDNLVYYWQ